MAPCISGMLAPFGRSSSERAICFLVRGGCRLLGVAAFALVAAVVADFADRRVFLAIVVSMVLTPRRLRGVPTTPSPGFGAAGAGRGHGARPSFRHLPVTLSLPENSSRKSPPIKNFSEAKALKILGSSTTSAWVAKFERRHGITDLVCRR